MSANQDPPSLRHVAIIMDGNGRWAQRRGWPRLKGHHAGAETVRCVLQCCRRAGIQYLTLYAFSKENWRRPKAEVDGLMRLLRDFLRRQEAELHDQRVRLRVMGCREDLSAAVRREIERVEVATASYEAGQLILALSYGGRTEIAHAARQIASLAARGELDPASVDEQTLARHLYLPDVPDPDLIIRTSGEQRISNFLLWQSAYSEFYVTPVLWPDFREADFQAALDNYAARLRRFGGIEAGTPPQEKPPC
ncbi:MAG: di-trans,poly-cis-decaprenylcistransferase [Lentisphaerae bacterium]|jgi:undecaprenyl diphosphate synthase|nr:di-trans,poly-cis-decaprenylcistransferase [Lentisphaerota bacterium]